MDIWGLLCSGYSSKQCLSLHAKPAPFSLRLVDEEINLRQIRGTASTRITAGPSRSSSPALFLRNLNCAISTASESHAWQHSTLPGCRPKDTCPPLLAKRAFQASPASLCFVPCVYVSFSGLLPRCLHRKLVLSDSFKLKGSSVPGIHHPLTSHFILFKAIGQVSVPTFGSALGKTERD